MDADNALEAAQNARMFQLDGETLATVFTVHDRKTGETKTIDLLFEDEYPEEAEESPNREKVRDSNGRGSSRY